MSLKEGEIRRKVISNKVIVTLVIQGLPSSFLRKPLMSGRGITKIYKAADTTTSTTVTSDQAKN